MLACSARADGARATACRRRRCPVKKAGAGRVPPRIAKVAPLSQKCSQNAFDSAAAIVALGAVLVLAGCTKNPMLVKRSPCPAVAVPTYTGDVTLFTPGTQPDAANIDVVATITDIRETCTETDTMLTTTVTYDVLARRNATAGARTVSLPVFATIVQGGNLIVSKQVGAVRVDFADGQARATGKGEARADVSRAATQPARGHPEADHQEAQARRSRCRQRPVRRPARSRRR